MLWGILVLMLLAAAVVIALPLYRKQGQLSAMNLAALTVVFSVSAGMYAWIGSPGAKSGASTATTPEAQLASVEDMVGSLEARLESSPDDLNGWKMLGRSQMQLRNFPKAIAAFEKAVALEGSNNGDTLISLGEAVLYSDEATLNGRAGQLFETGLALSPANSGGLFYGGLAAERRGDTALAAERWEMLLNSSPPPEIRSILENKITEWRGGAPVVAEAAPAVAAGSVAVTIEIPERARAEISDANSVFVIARDPAQPAPPLAVVRKRLGEIAGTVSIGDANAMIPGRVPSAFDEVEILVRISGSGQPIAQSGDWFGQMRIRPASTNAVTIVVDQQVP